MRIVIASGKGGTGKTTVATSLALVAGPGATYVDADVEEPDGRLFLAPADEAREIVSLPRPVVDEGRCTSCGACREVCRFKAVVVLPSTVMVFDELCHACGGCTLACPEGAIREEPRRIGELSRGRAATERGPVGFLEGRLDVGVASSPPLIRAVKRTLPDEGEVFIDAPPGTACPAIEAMIGADLCLLVTEPTPFGLHDLRLAVDAAEAIGLPARVVINRDGIGDDRVEAYCRARGLPILARLPDDRRVAEAYARGERIVDAVPGARARFEALLAAVREAARDDRAGVAAAGGVR